MRLIVWSILALGLLLQGCAHAPSPVQGMATSMIEQSFVLNGRLAVNHRGQRSSASVRWTYQPGNEEVLLMGPLGITLARIHQGPIVAVLEADGQTYRARHLEGLMDRVLGWHLPVHELHAWAMGRPYDKTTFQAERDGQGRLLKLYQDGWEISYQRYRDETPVSLPQRLTLRHDDLELQMVVDGWEALP